MQDAVKAETAFPDQAAWASGGVAVRFLGKRASNDLIWKDVRVEKEGRRTLEFACAFAEDRRFRVEIDGRDAGEVRVPATSDVFETFALDVTLSVGLHSIRLSNPSDWMPDVDRMVLR